MDLPYQNDWYILTPYLDYSNDNDATLQGAFASNAQQSGSKLTQLSDSAANISNDTYNCQYCQTNVEITSPYGFDAENTETVDLNDSYRVVSSWAGGIFNNDNSSNSPFKTWRNVAWPTWYDIKTINKCENQCYNNCNASCNSGCYASCYYESTATECGGCASGCTAGCTTACTAACTTGCTSNCTAGCQDCTTCASCTASCASSTAS